MQEEEEEEEGVREPLRANTKAGKEKEQAVATEHTCESKTKKEEAVEGEMKQADRLG